MVQVRSNDTIHDSANIKHIALIPKVTHTLLKKSSVQHDNSVSRALRESAISGISETPGYVGNVARALWNRRWTIDDFYGRYMEEGKQERARKRGRKERDRKGVKRGKGKEEKRKEALDILGVCWSQERSTRYSGILIVDGLRTEARDILGI